MERQLQDRVARAMFMTTVVMMATGLIAIGNNVGQRDARRPRFVAAAVSLRGAEVVPPAANKDPETTTSAPAPATEPAPVPPAVRGALPVGKGMWLYQPTSVEGGNVDALVARAEAVGLTHVFVRTGSSKTGFYAADYLSKLLPVAHAHGIRVYGWDFPYFNNVAADIDRAVAAISYTTPDGQRIDGFSADIELLSMGVKVTPANASAYGIGLRQRIGTQYPLIATVPRPSPKLKNYPYANVVASFDAIAPMVYWLNRDPVTDVRGAIASLSHFGKPVIPIGQAYDGAADHGPPGVPGRASIQAFMAAADDAGAPSVSFWSWQHATQEAWDAIRDSANFTLPTMPDGVTAGQLRAYQHLLTSLGFATPIDGVLSQSLTEAINAYQRAAHLPVTGVIDVATKALLLRPFRSPSGV